MRPVKVSRVVVASSPHLPHHCAAAASLPLVILPVASRLPCLRISILLAIAGLLLATRLPVSQASDRPSGGRLPRVTVGLVFVDSPVGSRQLQRTYTTFGKMTFLKDRPELANLTRRYELAGEIVELKTSMAPVDIVSKLCDELLSKHINIVFYVTTNDVTDETAVARFTVSTLRFLRLPIVLWISDNSLSLQVTCDMTLFILLKSDQPNLPCKSLLYLCHILFELIGPY